MHNTCDSMVKWGSVRIEPARSAEDLEFTAQLFTAYTDSLGLDLSFQEFSTELKSLPGKYAPPTGEILLARDGNGTVLGCVAVRPLLPPNQCEMKRLYISSSGRGLGIGKKLVHQVLDVAASLGYTEIKLDTLPSMIQAISLYESAGFAPTTPYYKTPLTGTVFLARQLQAPNASTDSKRTSATLASRDTVRKT